MQDLDDALLKLKPGKSSGPNDIPGEIHKHASFSLKLYLLDHVYATTVTLNTPSPMVVMLVNNHQKDMRPFKLPPHFSHDCII